ncbi:putative laccase-1 [Vitis vinifera]|uniref:Putative laccase-1 n=1 Tax=Vitis vinifera TaxID=29760 RepID=A0A438GBJ6_VITVI|nr:putative laccase-1 [Vitis vinifera]
MGLENIGHLCSGFLGLINTEITKSILTVNGSFFFSIANHTITLVGLDAAYVKPVTNTYLVISPGQTMDVLVTANQALGHYYMAARQYSNTKPDILYFDHANATEILQYRGNYTPPSSPFFPSSTLPSYKDFIAAANFTTRFRSLASLEHPTNVPQNATTRMFIVVSMGEFLGPNSSCNGINGNGSKLASSMNNISWVNPPIDVLMAYYRYISQTIRLVLITALPMKGTKVKVLEYNETVEIVFQGTNVLDNSEAHPMHLHGHSFYVIGTGIGNFDEETDPKGYNLVDPPLVNTVEVPQEGWATIRFMANNPGVRFMHCHYDRHLSWGMDFAFIVKNGDTSGRSMRHPLAYMPPCTASAADHSLRLFDFSDEKLNTFFRT